MSFSIANSLPERERKMLEEEAARNGQEPDALLVFLVGEGLLRRRSKSVPDLSAASPNGDIVAGMGTRTDAPSDEDEVERFRHWADGQPRRGVPVIPLEALDREHIYGDHA